MFLDLLIIIFSIFLMMIPGYLSARKSFLGEKSLLELSCVLVNFIYPCLIFSSLLNSFNSNDLANLWYLPAICFGIMLLGFLLGQIFIKLPFFSGLEEKRAFLLQCSINNYSFLPMPIAFSLYGDKGVAIVIYSSIGAEIALWILGVGSLHGFSFDKRTLKKFFSPPLLGLYFAIFLIVVSGYFSFDLKGFISSDKLISRIMLSIKLIGSATVPVAMIVCGGRLALMSVKEFNKISIWLLIGARLLIIPLVAIFAIYLLPISGEYKNVLYIVASMPVAVASILLSEIYGGDKDFIAATVMLTHLFSLLTVPILLSLAQYLN